MNGTCGGPGANAHAQALDWNGNPINGSAWPANNMAAVTAGVYGGAGGDHRPPA